MIFCPACGTENDDDSQFCKKCGRSLDDAKQARIAATPSTGNAIADSEGRLIADDGLPVGEDVDGVPGGERPVLLLEGHVHVPTLARPTDVDSRKTDITAPG